MNNKKGKEDSRDQRHNRASRIEVPRVQEKGAFYLIQTALQYQDIDTTYGNNLSLVSLYIVWYFTSTA